MLKSLLRLLLFLLLLMPTALSAQGAPEQINRALDDLSQRAGTTVTLDNVTRWGWSQDNYPDTSLGCPQPGQMYAQVITPGYQFDIVYAGTLYDYRVAADGSIVLLCSATPLDEVVTPTPDPDSVDRFIPCANPEPGIIYTRTRLIAGMQARVAPEQVAQLYTEPAATAASAGSMPGEAVYDITSGPVCADGQVWWQVNIDGAMGWTPEAVADVYVLEPQPGRPLPANLAALTTANVEQIAQIAVVQGNVIPQMAAAPAASTIAVLGGLGTQGVWLYDLTTLDTPPRLLRGEHQLTDVAYDPDGRLLVGDVTGFSRIWETNPDAPVVERVALLTHTPQVTAVAFDPAGRTFVSAGPEANTTADLTRNFTSMLWDIESVRQIAYFIGHTARVNELAFSPDSARLASASDDGTVRLWNPATSAQVSALETGATVTDLVFSPDSARLAAVDSTRITIWDVASGQPVQTIPTETEPVSVGYNADGSLLAVGGASLVVLDTATGTALLNLRPPAPVSAVAFVGDVLVTVDEQLTIRFWGVSPDAG